MDYPLAIINSVGCSITLPKELKEAAIDAKYRV